MGSPILEIKGGKELRIVGTKSSTFIIGWIAFVLGILMDGIFYGINAIGLPYVGLAIILFTIVIYLAMTPLQVKMQRFSKMTAVIQPEVEAIQAKYKNKKDPDSQQKQMDETQAVYRKYGVSPTGSCVQLFIQMPVLFALYEVLNRIPGYITLIGNQLTDMVNTSGFSSFFNTFVTGLNNSTLNQTMTSSPQTANYVDTLYKLNSKEWASLLQAAQGQDFLSKLQGTHAYVTKVTDFLSLNISDSPMAIFHAGLVRQGIPSDARGHSLPDPCMAFPVDELQAHAAAGTETGSAERHAELHEVDEYDHAGHFSRLLLHASGRPWHLLGSRCGCPYDPAARHQQEPG
jgi:YidC/Oxa1 family membrane protein insertase